MKSTRRNLIQTGFAAVMLGAINRLPTSHAAQDISAIVTGFPAGGSADAICRRVAQHIAPGFSRTTVVENRTGAGGQIAVSTVVSRPPDGATILLTPTSMLTIYPHIYKKLPYNAVTDLTPVSIGCKFDFGLAVGPLVPANINTVRDFLEWAKANPAGANFGSPAPGSTPHFIGALLGRLSGIDLRHVAYRGAQPAMLDLLSGNISAVSVPLGDITQHRATGRVRILAVSGEKRSRFAPDVPTYGEQGISGMAHSEWFAFFMPARAAPSLVERLNVALSSALASKEVVDGLSGFGLEAISSSPDELVATLKRDTAKWAHIVRDVGFTAEG